jgi:hypothetical protein
VSGDSFSRLCGGPTFADGDDVVQVAPANRPRPQATSDGLVYGLPAWVLVVVLVALVAVLGLAIG